MIGVKLKTIKIFNFMIITIIIPQSPYQAKLYSNNKKTENLNDSPFYIKCSAPST